MSDQTYIDNIKAQVASGMYDHLFYYGYGDEKEAKRDLVFLDIGANVGIVSIYAVPYCKRIVAAEPCPSTFEVLKFNTKEYPIIECLELALTLPPNGERAFYVNDVNFTASSTVNTYGKRITVQGKALASILKENGLDHVDVCKVDCEGEEGEALDYYQIDNAKDIIKTYFIEVHNCPKTSWEHKLGTIVGNLARCGYSKIEIDGMAITATRP